MISRKKSFIIAGGIILAFFIGGALLFKQRPTIMTPLGEVSVTVDAEGGPKIVLNDFHRSETKNGKLLWDVRATEGSFSPTNQTAQVKNPQVRLFKKQGEVNLTSSTADIAFQGQTLARAHLIDAVKLVQLDPPFTMETNEAFFNQSEQKLEIPGKVSIEAESISIKGEGLNGKLDTGVFVIERNVKSVISVKPKVIKTRAP